MPIGSLPAFQRALLKRHAQSRGRGQMTRTSDISGKIAGDLFRRQLAYRDIALGRKARMEGARQFGERLDLQKKKIRTAEKELPIRTGLGLATSGFAALQGMERRHRECCLTRRIDNG
jgi:hypothetical protein